MAVQHHCRKASVSPSNLFPLLARLRPTAHLGLDLLGRVGEEDGGVGIAGTHLGLCALQGREEGRVQQGWFGIADPRGHVPRHSEVGVL